MSGRAEPEPVDTAVNLAFRSGRGKPPGRPSASPPRPGSRALVLAVLVLACALGLPRTLLGQNRLHAGVHGSWASELAGGTPGVGARASVSLAPLLPSIRVQATGDLFFPSCRGTECSYRELNLNAVLESSSGEDAGGTYLGAGVNVQRLDDPSAPGGPVDETEVGLNVLLGIALDRQGPVQPLLEIRYELFSPDGLQQLVLSAGVRL